MPHRNRIWTSLALAAALASCESADHGRAARDADTPPAAEPAPVVSEVVMTTDDEDEPVHDGRWLYERNCAGCHNSNGDGQGATMQQLGLKARDFKQGGFAFGNTREAIFRTITAGMPGSEVMPSFKVTLGDDDRWMIADFVLTLCPPPAAPALGTRIVVGDTPRMARGFLPPVADGKPRWARGLLLGAPEGVTFEYRVDDVRLLAVRQGEFADRTDWNDRGGGELVPLGTVFYAPGGGDPAPTFHALHYGNERDLVARLTATVASREALGLDYEVRFTDQKRIATVAERLRVEALSVGGAFTRSFEFRGDAESANLIVDLGHAKGAAKWIRGEPTNWQQAGRFLRGALPKDGWLVGSRGERFELVHVAGDKEVKLVRDTESLRFFVPIFAGADKVSARFSVTTIGASTWNEELLAKLGQELAR